MTGTIYSGINNIYRVRIDTGMEIECRIKGKVLKDDWPSYNPLAPGDRVAVELIDDDRGLITERLPRRNSFARWNTKGESWQIAAANIDLLLAVISTHSPPFRPRFVDRVLIAASQGGVPSVVLVNKIDQGIDSWIEDRIEAWISIGIEVLRASAETGEGLAALKARVGKGSAVLFGPSGVGKSTLLNTLIPGLDLTTGGVSKKYDRGRHVTNFGRLLDAPWGGHFVDTPGVREISVFDIEPDDLPRWFDEFELPSQECSFKPCSHRHEPQCGVIKAVEKGMIHSDRYENYLRIRDELERPLRR